MLRIKQSVVYSYAEFPVFLFFPNLPMTSKWIASLVAGTVLLGPASAFAATDAAATTKTTSDVSEEEILEVIDESSSNPVMMDGRGGGMIMPPYGMGGVQVDATITKEITPDFLAINAYCDAGKQSNRDTAKDTLEKIYQDIKAGVGKDGRVRKQGAVSIYPYYGPMGEDTSSFSANLSIFIRITNPAAAQRIADLVESKGCGLNWDVRLVDTQEFELGIIDDLTTRLNKRKKVFEKLLGKKLTRVVSASLYTWVDGYTTYDPETNKADATTTLSVSFDLGGRATLPSTTKRTRTAPAAKEAPKG